MTEAKVNVQEQVRLILDIANILRGPFKEDEYQKIIIPMTICRRFECMLEPTRDAVNAEIKAGRDNEIRLKKKSGYPIYNKSTLTIEKIIADPGKAHENFVLYLNSFNPLGVSIFNNLDFFKYVDLLAERKKLVQVLKRFANTDLSLTKVSSIQMGYIMEEIIRTYSENASAGDHFTPREVIKCLTHLLLAEGCEDLKVPGKIITLADYACGTGGMLYEGLDEIKRINESAEVELFGQDNNPWYSSIALAETIIRGQNPENIKLVESSLTEDAHSDQKMRLILMNPPFGEPWSKDKIGEEQYKKILNENTRAGGKYSAGLPQSGDMQMLFWELIISKLVNDNRNNNYGRAAVICNASPLFSGGSKSGESNIRKWLFEHDYVEAIIQFCPELFYNTGISIYGWMSVGYETYDVDMHKEIVNFRKVGTVITSQNKPKKVVSKRNHATNGIVITNEMIEEAHQLVKTTSNYGPEDDLITDCFLRFPYNTDPTIVAMKIGLIDITNSTHVSQHKSKISAVELAECIVKIKNIDERIKNGDPEVVNEIARCNGKINLFSFASKYCCYHNKNLYGRDDYSILDTVLKKHIPDYFEDITSSQIQMWQDSFDYKSYNDYLTRKLDELNITVPFRKRKLDHFIWFNHR